MAIRAIKTKRTLENPLVRATLEYLNNIGHFAYKTPNYPIYDQKLKIYRRLNNIRGIPDIHVWLKDGTCAAIETKGKTNQRKDQIYVQSQIEKRGGRYILAYSIDDIMKEFPNNGFSSSIGL